MPVTSFLLFPSLQGTIVSYVFGLGSIAFVLLKIRHGEITPQVAGYFKSFAMAVGLWLILLCGSQIGDLLHPQLDIEPLYLISDDNVLVLRSSLFTQSLYLLACVMIALYFRYFIEEAWLKYVYWGAWFLTIYGLYDWTFYLIFHQSGDFVANRTFANGDHPGSWSQTIDFGGLELLRLKSCLGEPSFFAAVVIPYLFMALEGRKRILTLLLFVCAILSTSTTAYLGLASCIFLQALWSKKNRGASLVILCLLVLAIITMATVYPETYQSLFSDKLSGETDSGRGRLSNIEDYKSVLANYSLLNWIFGVGFGYGYFSLVWSLTANTGILGDAAFLYTFIKPSYLLPREEGSEWLKIAMIAIMVVVALTLSELFVPTTWMFLGLAYRRLDQLNLGRGSLS